MHDERFKEIVVLGGNSDIAMATLYELSQKYGTRGITLVVRSQPGKMIKINKAEVRYLENDLSQDKEVPQLIDALQNADAVIYAAGVMDTTQMSTEVIAQSAQVNLVSVMQILSRFVGMASAKDLIIIGSVAGERGKGKTLYYGAFKAGLHNFTQGLQEAYPKINTLLVKPGFVRTKMTKDLTLSKALTSRPDALARCIVWATWFKRRCIYSSVRWRVMMAVLRVVPMPLWRQINR